MGDPQIRTPGRRQPALVVQGDTFHSIVSDVEALARRLAATSCICTDLTGEASAIAEALRERLDWFERDVIAAGLELPYSSSKL